MGTDTDKDVLARNLELLQRSKCQQFGAEFLKVLPTDQLGIAENVRSGLLPLHGLRHRPEAGTCRWYVWAGEELSNSPDFFQPLHISHIHEWCPQIESFLGLAPGWRFLIADKYEDVWFDPSLLKMS